MRRILTLLLTLHLCVLSAQDFRLDSIEYSNDTIISKDIYTYHGQEQHSISKVLIEATGSRVYRVDSFSNMLLYKERYPQTKEVTVYRYDGQNREIEKIEFHDGKLYQTDTRIFIDTDSTELIQFTQSDSNNTVFLESYEKKYFDNLYRLVHDTSSRIDLRRDLKTTYKYTYLYPNDSTSIYCRSRWESDSLVSDYCYQEKSILNDSFGDTIVHEMEHEVIDNITLEVIHLIERWIEWSDANRGHGRMDYGFNELGFFRLNFVEQDSLDNMVSIFEYSNDRHWGPYKNWRKHLGRAPLEEQRTDLVYEDGRILSRKFYREDELLPYFNNKYYYSPIVSVKNIERVVASEGKIINTLNNSKVYIDLFGRVISEEPNGSSIMFELDDLSVIRILYIPL